MAFVYKRNQILGHYGSELHHTQELVTLVEQGKLDLSASITAIYSLEEAAQALQHLEKKTDNPIRIILKP